jgi:hypothetical protein
MELSDNGRKAGVRRTLRFLMKVLRSSGAEFLDAQRAVSCQVGKPQRHEPKAERAARAKQELRVFAMLDHTSSWVRPRDTPQLDSWVLWLRARGYQAVNRRVANRGVLHVFFPAADGDNISCDDRVLDGVAEHLEAMLARSSGVRWRRRTSA